MDTFRIKNNRAGHFIVLLVVLILIAAVVWAFFIKEDPISFDTTGIIILTIMGIIGPAILFMSVRMIVLNPDVIVINEKGFEYNPGGVSSGFMYWTNVAEIKFVDVRTTQGQLNGPVWERTLAIKLKDPSLYRNQYNAILRGLMGVNKKMYDADIFFRLSSFGKQAEEVYSLMMKHWDASKAV